MTTALDRNGKRTALTLTAALAVGTLAGLGGAASFALWSDDAHLSGSVASGYEFFAAGPVGAVTPAPTGTASVSVGASDAATLVTDGELAIVLQTDSLSQGNKGLTYEITVPDWGTGIFGDADIELFWVASPSGCTVGATPPAPPATVSGLTSTPVSAAYSSTTAPVTEYWCLTASLDASEVIGDYENTVTATGTDPDSGPVSDTDSWHVHLTESYDPEAEETHVISFDYATFRPGVTP